MRLNNSNGEKVTAKAHGGPIDIQGVTVAHLSDKFQVTKLETWFDPLEMFRQIAPEGIVNKEVAAAAAAAGCPVMAAQAAANNATLEKDVKEVTKEFEQHSIDGKPTGTDSTSDVRDDVLLSAAREADKAVVDGEASLGAVTASESDPVNGEIPKPNAE